jgi:hypothetical protein
LNGFQVLIFPLTIGTIERGHIYFFYRPKVQVEEAHSIDDVRNLQMLLIPRPPKYLVQSESEKPAEGEKKEPDENAEMEVVAPGADAVPAPAAVGDAEQHYRLFVVGKKRLPDSEAGGGGKGKGRKQTFWATAAAVGDDLQSLERGLGEKTYETKTRGMFRFFCFSQIHKLRYSTGTRHQEPARLAARGAYAIVNNEADVPSRRTTHFGYYISHPEEMGEVQETLGIKKAAAYVMQVKNPLAPATIPGMHTKGAPYPEGILKDVFGKGERGRESYGLRFTGCEVPELLDYKGAEVILIATKEGEEGLETSLGEGRGKGQSCPLSRSALTTDF